MTPEKYTDWLAVARRHSRVASEAEDLLHDGLLAAAAAGRLDLAAPANRRWLAGALRRQAAFHARSAVRRRRRDAEAASDDAVVPPDPPDREHEAFGLGGLPRSARSVAVLALHGLGRDEICAVLGLAPTAFRQRLVALRRGLGAPPDGLQREALALARARRLSRAGNLALGLVRRALLARARVSPGMGTHDPDGHLLVFAA